MRWFVRIAILVVVLLLAYTAWPFVTLYRLSDAVQRNDVDALRELVDFPSVRRSMASQIVEKYLELSGQSPRLGPLGNIAANVGATLADPELEKIVTPEGLIALLQQGRVPGEAGSAAANATPAAAPVRIRWGDAFRLWADSDYGGRRVFFLLPPDVPRAQQYRLRLFLEDLAWRVQGVELPEPLALRLAQDIAKRNPK